MDSPHPLVSAKKNNQRLPRAWGGWLAFAGIVSVAVYQMVHQDTRGNHPGINQNDQKNEIVVPEFQATTISNFRNSDVPREVSIKTDFSAPAPNNPNKTVPQNIRKSDLDLSQHSETEIQNALKNSLDFHAQQIPALIRLIQQATEEETVVRATTALGALIAESAARSFLLQMVAKAEGSEIAIKAAVNGLSNKIEVFNEIPQTFYATLHSPAVGGMTGVKNQLAESLTRYELMRLGLAFERSPERVLPKKKEILQISDPEIRVRVMLTLGLK